VRLLRDDTIGVASRADIASGARTTAATATPITALNRTTGMIEGANSPV
jgi:hypothetical protein